MKYKNDCKDLLGLLVDVTSACKMILHQNQKLETVKPHFYINSKYGISVTMVHTGFPKEAGFDEVMSIMLEGHSYHAGQTNQ